MKSRIAMVASVLALAGLALAGSACGPAGEAYLGAMATARSEAIATESPEIMGRLGGDISVLYEVTGDANGVTITLVNETGGINQGDYTLPYKYWASFPQDTPILSISARIIDPIQGAPEVACRISILWWVAESGISSPLPLEVKAKASGPGNIATCLWENADN